MAATIGKNDLREQKNDVQEMATFLKKMSEEERKKIKYIMVGMQLVKDIEKAGQEVDIHMKKENNPKEQTTVRLPLELKERIQKEANRKGMSFNELVLIILNDWITPEK